MTVTWQSYGQITWSGHMITWCSHTPGLYWIDPNLGCASDAIPAYCNFTSGEMCITPNTTKVGQDTSLSTPPSLQILFKIFSRQQIDRIPPSWQRKIEAPPWFSQISGHQVASGRVLTRCFWLSNSGKVFNITLQIQYPGGRVQLNFLHLISSDAVQRITLHLHPNTNRTAVTNERLSFRGFSGKIWQETDVYHPTHLHRPCQMVGYIIYILH